VVGPWGHAETLLLPDGAPTQKYRLASLAPSIPWFDRYLTSRNAGAPEAPVRVYVMGANVWRDEHEWPLARARETMWYLSGNGHANSARGDGVLTTTAPDRDEAADAFESNPLTPVPTRGGAMLDGSGPVPQNDVEDRSDVLVYSTSPLDEAMEVTGPVSAVLFVATTAPSADFTAKLVDVHPDGTAYNVTDGIVRRFYPPAAAAPADAEPTEITISLWPTSMVFGKGHRIRLEIAGSNFPRFDRNPHTAERPATARTFAIATQAVHHGRHAASRIVLPEVPATVDRR
jgi:putative CocE/NonD family hydrolase